MYVIIKVASRSHQVGSARVAREQGRAGSGRVGFGLLFLLSRTVSTWVTLFPDWVVVTHLYDHAVVYPLQLSGGDDRRDFLHFW